MNINNIYFYTYTYLGSENLGQIYCYDQYLRFTMSFSSTMLTSLFCSFWLFYNKKYSWAYVERRLFTLLESAMYS